MFFDGEKKPKAGKLLHKLKDDIDRPLSATLSLNTIAHTVGAAGVGAQAQLIFGRAYVGITSAILTLLILVISEIIPKTLGANHWKKLAGFAAKTSCRRELQGGYPAKKIPSVSREEFSAMAEIGYEEGVLKKGNRTFLKI